MRPIAGARTRELLTILIITMLVCPAGGGAWAEESTVSPSSPETGPRPGSPDKPAAITRLAESNKSITVTEPADAILIQRKEFEWTRHLRTALHVPEWIDLGLEHRTRFESYDHPWRSSQAVGNGQTDSSVALRSRVRFGLGGASPFRFLFEGQDARAYLDRERGDFRDSTTINEFDIVQLLGSVRVDNVLGSGLRTDIHVGRMTMDVGSRRLIARNDFRNTTNSFDGFHWHIARDNLWRVRAFFVEPVVRDDVRLDTQYGTSLFWGTYVENRQLPWFQIDAYYFGLNDQRLSNGTTHRTYSTVGGRLSKDPQPGEIDYEVESAWQTGTRGGTNHFAHVQHVDFGYSFTLPWTPRLVFHYDYASGDRKPGDSQDEGFDTLFGARRWEYGPTGTFGPFFRTNIQSPGWRVIVTPAQGWTLQLKHRIWYLAQNGDFFGNSGLRDTTGRAGTSLGHDVEFRAQWAINSNMNVDAGYVHWFKGSYFDRLPISAGLPAGGNKDTDYVYVQMRVRV